MQQKHVENERVEECYERKAPPHGAGALGVSHCRAAPRAAGGTVGSWLCLWTQGVLCPPCPALAREPDCPQGHGSQVTLGLLIEHL